MSEVAVETAYYFHAKGPAVALIAKGVRFPAGRWMRIADADARAWLVEDMLGELFPALKGRVVPFVTLLSNFDVSRFEASSERG